MAIETVSKILKDGGAISVEFTMDEARQVQLWKGRKSMIPSLSRYKPDFVTVMLADDMAVPMSQIPKAVEEFIAAAAQTRGEAAAKPMRAWWEASRDR